MQSHFNCTGNKKMQLYCTVCRHLTALVGSSSNRHVPGGSSTFKQYFFPHFSLCLTDTVSYLKQSGSILG